MKPIWMRKFLNERRSKLSRFVIVRVLEAEQWQALESTRKAFILPWLESYRERRARRESHPVHDFLFTYYQMNRQTLSRWRPMLLPPSMREHLKSSGC